MTIKFYLEKIDREIGALYQNEWRKRSRKNEEVKRKLENEKLNRLINC